jgi:hypothetical protein
MKSHLKFYFYFFLTIFLSSFSTEYAFGIKPSVISKANGWTVLQGPTDKTTMRHPVIRKTADGVLHIIWLNEARDFASADTFLYQQILADGTVGFPAPKTIVPPDQAYGINCHSFIANEDGTFSILFLGDKRKVKKSEGLYLLSLDSLLSPSTTSLVEKLNTKTVGCTNMDVAVEPTSQEKVVMWNGLYGIYLKLGSARAKLHIVESYTLDGERFDPDFTNATLSTEPSTGKLVLFSTINSLRAAGSLAVVNSLTTFNGLVPTKVNFKGPRKFAQESNIGRYGAWPTIAGGGSSNELFLPFTGTPEGKYSPTFDFFLTPVLTKIPLKIATYKSDIPVAWQIFNGTGGKIWGLIGSQVKGKQAFEILISDAEVKSFSKVVKLNLPTYKLRGDREVSPNSPFSQAISGEGSSGALRLVVGVQNFILYRLINPQ